MGTWEHVFGLTSKGSITGQLQRALAKRDVLAVRSLAGELPSVPLPTAAEITVLLLREKRDQALGSSAMSFLPATDGAGSASSSASSAATSAS